MDIGGYWEIKWLCVFNRRWTAGRFWFGSAKWISNSRYVSLRSHAKSRTITTTHVYLIHAIVDWLYAIHNYFVRNISFIVSFLENLPLPVCYKCRRNLQRQKVLSTITIECLKTLSPRKFSSLVCTGLSLYRQLNNKMHKYNKGNPGLHTLCTRILPDGLLPLTSPSLSLL